jgi:Carboxypeptidase regulatory-like domain/TonB dependent receptor/TonB-dependent Receptor Plug Domain
MIVKSTKTLSFATLNLALLFMTVTACLVLGSSSSAYAQQAAGAITGTVVDQTGAPIPNAEVTVHDLDRGTKWTSKTSSAGIFEFPQIAVGNVEVKVEANGFAVAQHNPFTLALNQVARLDFTMKVGNVNTTVEVVEAPPLLQTASTEMSTLIDSNAATSLPLATRNTNELTLLAPGVVSPNIFAFQSSQNTFGTGRPYVNGAREQDNNFSLDGMDINQADNNDVAYVPSPDALQQFNIITSNAPADFGNYIGGVVVESLKSGTNQFHGNFFEFFRNTDFNANTWQNKANAYIVGQDASGNGSTLPRAALQWNDFGATFGGPIVKNKLFFFTDFQGAINNTPRSPQSNSVIPTQYLSGNFAALCTSQGAVFINGVCSNPVLQLYKPASGVTPGGRTPFLNNQVPVSSSVAAAIIASPEFAQQEGLQSYFTAGYVHTYQGDAKIDWQASTRDHVMGRYSQMYTINTSTNGTNVLTPNLTREYPLKNFVVNWDHVLTPSLVNELRLGAQIFPANDQEYTNAANGNLPERFGLPGVPGDILPLMTFGYQPIGSTNGIEIFHDTTIQVEDAVTWTHGKHSIHTGFEWYHYIMNDLYAGNNGASGQFIFSGQYTGNPNVGPTQANGLPVGALGSPFADFLLGLPQQVQQGAPLNFNLRNSLFGAFVQDTYQATHNVTLTLGLRYELTTARGDEDASKNVNYDLITGQPQIGKNYNTYTGITNFQPRLGIAWQPGWAPNTVVRAAYDLSTYMEGNGVNNMAVINPPNVIMTNILNNSGAALNLPATTLDQGYSTFSTACTAAQFLALAPNCISGVQAHATDPNLRPAVDQQWNLVVQHQFSRNATASLGYVGNKIDHLSDIYLYNQKQINSLGAVVPGPYMQQLLTAGVGQARYNASDGISTFNALEATVAQRNYHGLDLQFSYTWSKCLTNTLGYFGSYGDEEGAGESQTQATQNFFQNEYDPKADYGRCTTDAASNFGGYALYNLPFGQGKTFAAHANNLVNQIIGGWQTAVDMSFRSGFGITPFAGTFATDANPLSASSLTGSYQPRPNCVTGVSSGATMQTVQIGSSIGKVDLNPASVTGTDNGQFGTCSSGALRGPSLKTANLNVTKNFPLTERVNMAFAAQFINLTNTPIFSVPASWWGQYSSCASCNAVRTTGPNGGGSGTVGAFGLLDGSNPGRQIELSLKLNY